MIQTKNIKSPKRGFTIIEVVLVLAIAGLIFLMVFIALPALQRSQRDAQRRNDYSMLSTQVTSYITNNGGRISKLTKEGAKKLDEKQWINAEGTDPNGYSYTLYACSYDQWKDGETGGCGTVADAEGGVSGKLPGKVNEGSEVLIITGANCDASDSKGNAAPKSDTGIRAYIIYGHLEGGGTYCQDNNRTGVEDTGTKPSTKPSDS